MNEERWRYIKNKGPTETSAHKKSTVSLSSLISPVRICVSLNLTVAKQTAHFVSEVLQKKLCRVGDGPSASVTALAPWISRLI